MEYYSNERKEGVRNKRIKEEKSMKGKQKDE